MVVFSNHRLGPSAEFLVSAAVASAMLRETVAAARPLATSRWELELVTWLDERVDTNVSELDVSDLAWTRDHFEHQKSFVTAAIALAAAGSENGPALTRWRRMIEAHPPDAVQFGRRWAWLSPSPTA
ncbi:MAG: hypothetical protein JWO36_3697 [Myxococcales bacterium]|nr:hypothetical protein [Myxococcales bacterium]